MISVADAQAQIARLIQPLATQTIPLTEAAGRVLATPVLATRDQPPFPASAMDGYAVIASDLADGAMLNVVDEVPAGDFRDITIRSGQAVRIFTGAPVPESADHILIQEDAERSGNQIAVKPGRDAAHYVRPAGGDFIKGAKIDAPRLLGPSDIALIASMGHPRVEVYHQPDVALIATGDELVWPGEPPAKGQIVASNTFGLKAQLEAFGARVRILPIAGDTLASLKHTFDLARDADLIITIGGASVGDRDLVAHAAGKDGLNMAFHKIAMRPGKPLMAGKLGKSLFLGLPGNPVSSMVCGLIFVGPALRAMQGLTYQAPQSQKAVLASDLPANGPREHYMRAHLEDDKITPAKRQDSSLLTVLAGANALIVRPPHDPAKQAGSDVKFIKI